MEPISKTDPANLSKTGPGNLGDTLRQLGILPAVPSVPSLLLGPNDTPAAPAPAPVQVNAEPPLTEGSFWELARVGLTDSLGQVEPANLRAYVTLTLGERLSLLPEYDGRRDAGPGWGILFDQYGDWRKPAPGVLSGPARLSAIPSLNRSPSWQFAGVMLALFTLSGYRYARLIESINAGSAMMATSRGGALFAPISAAWKKRINPVGLPDDARDSLADAAEETLIEFARALLVLCVGEAVGESMMIRLRMEREAVTADFKPSLR